MALFGRWRHSTQDNADLGALRGEPAGIAAAPALLPPATASASADTTSVRATVYSGGETLGVAGESYYQDALRQIMGSPATAGLRKSGVAVLVPQHGNPFDDNAVQVQIDGRPVGHLSRDDAALYRPGVLKLMEGGSHVALHATVSCGGGSSYGVFLDHDPTDFGLPRSSASPVRAGQMRTGLSEAWLSDVDDDDYDLSWMDTLPNGDRPSIDKLRTLLADDPDPIDRHFQFAELESRLYRCRDLYDTALDEYDEVCRRHDAEMETICAAFRAKWGKVPMLETYKQMAVRLTKAKEWERCLWWIDRGLALYGTDAARVDAVEDLQRRRTRVLTKLGRTA